MRYMYIIRVVNMFSDDSIVNNWRFNLKFQSDTKCCVHRMYARHVLVENIMCLLFLFRYWSNDFHMESFILTFVCLYASHKVVWLKAATTKWHNNNNNDDMVKNGYKHTILTYIHIFIFSFACMPIYKMPHSHIVTCNNTTPCTAKLKRKKREKSTTTMTRGKLLSSLAENCYSVLAARKIEWKTTIHTYIYNQRRYICHETSK